jgi:hypothetical protein
MISEDPYKIEKPKEQQGLLATTMQQAPKPANTSLADGDLKMDATGAYYTPQASVANQLSGLLAKESPYMTAARSSSQQAANSRGILNSTMAGTAGEKAAIESALPIAQQDAGYHQDLGRQASQGDITSRLQGEQGNIQKGLYETQGDINSRLQAEQGNIQKGLYETQGDISKQLSAQDHQQKMAMQDADISWKKLDLESRMQVEAARLSQDAKVAFDQSVNAISQDYMKDYMELMLNPNLKTPADRNKAIAVLAENTRQRYAAAAAIAGFELEWDIPNEAVAEQESAQPIDPKVPTSAQPGPGYVWDAHNQKWVYSPSGGGGYGWGEGPQGA